jgi:hypothetical protein
MNVCTYASSLAALLADISSFRCLIGHRHSCFSCCLYCDLDSLPPSRSCPAVILRQSAGVTF